MSLHGYSTRVDEYDSEEDEMYRRSPYQSPRFQRSLSLQKPPPSRFNPGYYGPEEDDDEDGLNLPMHGMSLGDYPPRWTPPPPFFEEPPRHHPGYMRRPFFAPEEEYPYFPDPMRPPPPPPQFWSQRPPNDLRFQADRLSDNEMAREMPYLHRSFSSRSHRHDRPNHHRPLQRRFQDLEDESDDEPPLLFRRSSTGSRKLPLQHQQQHHQQQQQQRRRRRANSLSSMPNPYHPPHPHHPKDRIRSNAATPYPSDDSMDNTSEEGDLPPPLRGGPGLNRSHSFGNFPPPPHPPPPMQPNIQPVILPQNIPIENGPPPPPMGPPNSMFVPQPGDYFEPRMNNNQEGTTGPSTPSANEANGSQNGGNNGMGPPPMGPWMGHHHPPPHQVAPVFPTSPGGNNPMFNQQNMMAMGMANPMVNMFNNPMMGPPPPMWGFPNYPLPFMNSGEPPMVNPGSSTSPHRSNDNNEVSRPDSGNHEQSHPPHHPEMQTPHMPPPPPPPQSMMKPESSRRRFSLFNLFGKKNEYHFEPPMQQPFPEDQFRGGGGGGGPPMPPPPLPPPGNGGFPGIFSVPIQDRSSSKKEQKKIEQYEKLGVVWAWRIIQDADNLENIRMYCPNVDPNRFYSFNINNQKLINKKANKEQVMLGSEKLLHGNLMIRPPHRDAFFIPKDAPIRSDPVVIRLEIIYQTFNRGELGNGFVFNPNHM